MIRRNYKLSGRTRELYNRCIDTNKFINLDLEFDIEPEHKRSILHMLEGGSMCYNGEYHMLPNNEKINAIYQEFGDKTTNVIMYRFPSELSKLRKKFKHTKLIELRGSYDLSHFNNMIIYSYYPSKTRFKSVIPTFIFIAEDTVGEDYYDNQLKKC